MTIARIEIALIVAAVVTAPHVADAQGGGAGQVGAIAVHVRDASGLPVPGATVTLARQALGTAVRSVTPESGSVRIAGVPIGDYVVSCELPGFVTVRRTAIGVHIGFTVTLDFVLVPAPVAESVVVEGDETPLVDRVSTRVTNSFTRAELERLPNARDEWALYAITPGILMMQADVGGSRAGRVTPSTAYGFGVQDPQVRVLLEGINITENTSRSGAYLDFGAHEEAYVGTLAQGAEMPTPGVLTQFVSRSGSNQLRGDGYADFENRALQASNLPDQWFAPSAFGNMPIREGSNETDLYRDVNIGSGGPVRRNRWWWYGSARHLQRNVEQPAFGFGDTQDTTLWNASGKTTYQLSRQHRLVGYYQWAQKLEPRVPGANAVSYTTAADTQRWNSGTWIWKGEWNHSVANRLFLEARYGAYGYYFSVLGQSDAPFRFDGPRQLSEGGDVRRQQDRARQQLTSALSWLFVGGGLHSLRLGAERDGDGFWQGFERLRAANVLHQFNNGVSTRVTFGLPTADGPVGDRAAHNRLLSKTRLDRVSAFVSDEWTVTPRVALNIGVRWDRYHAWAPEQQQLASTVGPVTIPAVTFPRASFVTWRAAAPRLGAIWDLQGTGRTVLKMSVGLFRHSPGTDAGASANPNQANKNIIYQWNDRNGNRLYDLGEEGAVVASSLSAFIAIDPNLRQPSSREITAYLERQVGRDIALRAGVVRKASSDLWQPYRPGRPPSAYTVPFSYVDDGVDGIRGTSDDRTFSLLGLPNAQVQAGAFPVTRVVQNVPAIARYTSVEASAERRLRNRWSAALNGTFTWSREHAHWVFAGNRVTGEVDTFPAYYPNSPNDTSLQEYTTWSVKGRVTYDTPWNVHTTMLLRHQSGQPYGRTLNIDTNTANAIPGSGAFFSGLILVEPLGTRRMDHISLLDLRVEKSIRFADRSIGGLVDVFNVFNSHAAHGIAFATGPSFRRPIASVAPRTFRIAARARW